MISRFTYALTAFILSSSVASAYIAPGGAAGGAQTATPQAQTAPSSHGNVADVSVGVGTNRSNIYDRTDYNPGYYGSSDSNSSTQYEYDTADYSPSYYADPQVRRQGPYYRPYHRYYRR